MNEALEYFKTFTGAKDEVAQRYLGLTENIPEHAIQLFYDSPDLASALEQPPSTAATSRPNIPAESAKTRSNFDNVDVINIQDDVMDSEKDEASISDFRSDLFPTTDSSYGKEFSYKRSKSERNQSDPNHLSVDDETYEGTVSETKKDIANPNSATDIESDEAVARRIQAELYGGPISRSGHEEDSVRAPIERRKEILVGGDGDWQGMHTDATSMHHIRNGLHSRPGVFNQSPVPSIWESGSDPTALWQGLSQATGGASETSSKAARLAELFRPPFEIMRQVSWDVARAQGKKEGKWIMVNIQDKSIFDCQQLNRDIWKDPGVKEALKENFIFVQYSNDDHRASQYIQFYFQNKDNSAAYPHIAIVDPRTGEQVKIWSGRPVPQAPDFLMQIYEFLDRYSLDMAKKNPVANRKPENIKSFEVDRMTEEEMLDIAMQNSLTNNIETKPLEGDPDDLTRSLSDLNKGKGKEVVEDPEKFNSPTQEVSPSCLSFAQISSKNVHTEPPVGQGTTRIQFKHAGGRIVRVFNVNDQVRRIYEWLKSDPVEDRSGVDFELKVMGRDLIAHLDESIEECGLKNGTIMVEFLQSDD